MSGTQCTQPHCILCTGQYIVGFSHCLKARYLRVFGCPAWVLIPKEKRTKLAKRAWQGVFVGYKEETDKIYLVWNPTDKKVHEVRFVEFDESKSTGDTTGSGAQLPGDEKDKDTEQGESADDDESETEDQSALQDVVEAREEGPQDDVVSVATREEIADEGSTEPDAPEIEDEGLRGDTIVVDTGEGQRAGDNSVEAARPRSEESSKTRSRVRIEVTERRVSERLKKRGESSRTERAMVARALLQPNADIYDFDPKKLTFQQAMRSNDKDKWTEAVDEEVQNLIRRQTFSGEISEAELQGEEVVDAKLVFDHKKDEDGKILRYKARLVARGFTQKHGVNYEETFAPTIRLDAMRIILALAAKKGWKVYQMDAVAAFLAANLEEKIFLKVPNELQQHFGKYVQILKSLYGLKQAARMWYLLVSDFLKEIGFSPMAVDPTIFRHTGSGVIIGVHVDDFMITGEDENAIRKVKKQLHKRFEMKDLGEAENILGIRIRRHERKADN